jgi:hypothetical protein
MTNTMNLEFGLDTFGDVTVDATGIPLSQAQVILPHERLMTAIELYGREVVPRVRELLASARRPTPPSTRRGSLGRQQTARSGRRCRAATSQVRRYRTG